MKLTRKLLIAVMTLVVTAIALGTTTYAWFTIGERVAVEDIKMQVKAGEGLEIAYMPTSITDPTSTELSYVKTLQSEYIYEMLVKDYFGTFTPGEDEEPGTWAFEPALEQDQTYAEYWAANFEMDAVTSKDGKTFQKIEEEKDEYPYLYSLTEEPNGISKENNFIEFKLAFRTLSTEELDLFWDHVSLTSKGVEWAPEVPFTSAITGEQVPTETLEDYYAANAARISINSGESTVVVFENADDKQGIRNTVLNTSNFLPNKGAHQYFKLMTGQTVIKSDANDEEGIMPDNYKTVDTITSLSNQKVATFPGNNGSGGYQYVTITVRIYIEGMDPEAFNSILGDTLTVQLGFLIDLDQETTTP